MIIKTDFEGFSNDRRGITGVSVIIVFAAMVLIATAAAIILINSGVAIRRHADRTANRTGAELSTGVEVVKVIGEVDNDDVVEKMKVVTKRKPGSPDVDLRGMTVLYVSDEENKYLKFGGMGARSADNKNFGLIMIRNLDGQENYMLTGPGDMVEIVIDAKEIEAEGGLKISDEVEMELMPEIGFETPFKVHICPDIAGKKVAILSQF